MIQGALCGSVFLFFFLFFFLVCRLPPYYDVCTFPQLVNAAETGAVCLTKQSWTLLVVVIRPRGAFYFLPAVGDCACNEDACCCSCCTRCWIDG